MLTKDEKDYLSKINPKKKVSIHPFYPEAKTLGESIVKKIKNHFPDLEVLVMGSVALKIAGQKDIDIYALANPKDFNKYLLTFEKLFGGPKHTHKTFTEWGSKKNGFKIEVYLTEPPKQQIRVFEILKSDKELLKEYENLKLKFDGKSFRSYQKAKYEFYNRILNNNLES